MISETAGDTAVITAICARAVGFRIIRECGRARKGHVVFEQEFDNEGVGARTALQAVSI